MDTDEKKQKNKKQNRVPLVGPWEEVRSEKQIALSRFGA